MRQQSTQIERSLVTVKTVRWPENVEPGGDFHTSVEDEFDCTIEWVGPCGQGSFWLKDSMLEPGDTLVSIPYAGLTYVKSQ